MGINNESLFTADELQRWLLEKAAETKDPAKSRKLLLANEMRMRATTMVGRMFFFKYDPKLKATLPKYDKFPLVVVLERSGMNFFGINLHYLSGGERAEMLKLLEQFENNTLKNETTKLLVNYSILQSVSQIVPLAKPCYKRYLFNHCRSKFIEIYADEYQKAIQMPVENWYYKI